MDLEKEAREIRLERMAPEARKIYTDMESSLKEFISKSPDFPEKRDMVRKLGKSLAEIFCILSKE